MWGKHFASTYTGSMVGAGPELFAVWGYVIANTVGGQVELNPAYLAPVLGMSPDAVRQCIDKLCAPDPASRSKKAQGRRLIREGEFAYRVPNHFAYRAVRDEQDRREYNRRKKAEGRARGVNTRVKQSRRESSVSAKAEAEAEAEADLTTTTESKALVAPVGATGSALIAEFRTMQQHSHNNGLARETKAKLVFSYWAAKWDHPRAVYDQKRRSRLEARLKENSDNVSELLWVVDGAKRDDWAERPKYAGIEQLFRDRGTVERLSVLVPGGRAGEVHPMALKYFPGDANERG